MTDPVSAEHEWLDEGLWCETHQVYEPREWDRASAEGLRTDHSDALHRAGYRADCPACIANDAVIAWDRASAEGLREALVKGWGSEERGAHLTERVLDRLRDHLIRTVAEVLPSVDAEGNEASDVAEGIADNVLGLLGQYARQPAPSEGLAEAVSDSLAATTEGTDYAEAPAPSDEPGSPYVLRLTNELAARGVARLSTPRTETTDD